MEFITAEQFLKENKEVQEVINNSIKLCVGDRIYNYIDNRYYIFLGKEGRCYRVCDLKNKRIGLFANDVFIKSLTETDLRQFIEDKTNCKISCDIGEYGYQITLYKFNEGNIGEEYEVDYYRHFSPMDLNTCNLLQAYWKVAIEIAKKSL